MCGIAGIVEWRDGGGPKESLVREMIGMIRHRGPDQFGIYLDCRAALGSARLSIIDLSCGQQPIQNEDGSLWIVFNGEIFNYVELREELESRGHRFRTHTDTEVILHLYEELGPKCLERFNGQFAIAIWDVRKQVLFLARDRLGVRPLFYAESNGRFLFASEIKALFADDSLTREIDSEVLDQVFTFWAPLGPRTVFRGVLEIPPGHYALISERGVSVRRYWQLQFKFEGPIEAISRGNHSSTDELRELLIDATRIRLRADVAVGAYLSGGLDSSTIAAIVRNFTANQLSTFSIAFSDKDYDESEFQQRMADHLGTQHHVVRATHRDIGDAFPEVIWHTEVPLLRTSPVPMFLLSKLVRQCGLKVVLTGEGADEFLGGYDIFKEAKVRRFWARQPGSKRRPLLLQRLYADIPRMGRAGQSFMAAFFKERLTEVDAPCYSHFLRWKNNRRTRRFFSESILQAPQGSDDFLRQVPLPSEISRWGALERAQYLEVTTFLSQYLLSSQGDRVAMANSVEGRYPFLDRRVVEFCCALDARDKLRCLTEKYVLRKVAKSWLPDAVLKRPKRPYRAPIHRSFFGETAPDYVNDMLSSACLKNVGLFNPDAVAQLVKRVDSNSSLGETDEMALAGIISTQLLHAQFVQNFRKSRSVGEGDDLKLCGRTTEHKQSV